MFLGFTIFSLVDAKCSNSVDAVGIIIISKLKPCAKLDAFHVRFFEIISATAVRLR